MDVDDAMVSFVLEAHFNLYSAPESVLDSKLLNFIVIVANTLRPAVSIVDMKIKLAFRISKHNIMCQSCKHRNHLR